MPVQNLLDGDNSLPWEKKLGQKVENSNTFGCFKKYRKHNSAENDEFDDGRI